MPLDRIITDPIISTENIAFSPSRSRTPVDHNPTLVLEGAAVPTERDPLIATAPKLKKPFYRARPLWLVPFALIASLTRGMTLASRVEVFTELSCHSIHEHYNHTRVVPSLTPFNSSHYAVDPVEPHLISVHFPSPHISSDEYQEGDDDDDDPRVIPNKKCISDPAVQAGAARLQTIMTTTMGALSALTTGWWGQFGERHGRIRVLAIATFGLFLTDLTFILVSTPHSPLAAHSHKLLILAPIIEGSLGGWSTLTGANTAYIVDCTSPGSRATIFARFTGVLCIGLALGPMLGAWLIRHPIPFLNAGNAEHPLQSVTSVFWVAIACSFVNLILVLFVFPESLPASRRASNRKGKGRAVESSPNFPISKADESSQGWVATRIIRRFLSPLAVFLPSHVPVAASATGDSLVPSRTRKDWGLTFIGLSLFSHMLASGIFQIKYLYAEHIYDWAAEQLSYYISFMGACRAWHLLVLLPFLLLKFKPVRAAVPATDAPANPAAPTSKPKPTKSHLFSEMQFDLRVVRYSMLIDFLSHALVVIAPLPSRGANDAWWSQFMFVGATSLSCVGAGVMPGMQSLALCTLQGRALATKEAAIRTGEAQEHDNDAGLEPGKLFGALAVLQAIGQTILGPMLFGVIYSSTVGSFPKAIFATASGLVLLSIAFTILVRPDVSLSIRKPKVAAKGKTATRPYGAKPKRRYQEQIRGRSRVSKDLRGGAARADYDVRFDASDEASGSGSSV
ncbi:major facilitator superfamily-domain-containing protein [Suillus clintonianus]|uniref:major facilitator superfamily-domain-containing protein n=1 Tax=Suillus clintonianus TaxID=1904413 RepID=UPI001B8611A3|nr:major facilitator superfamily-domain-containing protein [Suillus clintonianus]KAG2131332.1 major facilitator superfamily-domain-containing protein [Suillus clintonianus]